MILYGQYMLFAKRRVDYYRRVQGQYEHCGNVSQNREIIWLGVHCILL